MINLIITLTLLASEPQIYTYTYEDEIYTYEATNPYAPENYIVTLDGNIVYVNEHP